MTVSTPTFSIGNTAWIARAGFTEKWIQCPDCCGKGALTVILGDESRVSIRCSCAEYPHSIPGSVKDYEFAAMVYQITIDGVETSLARPTRYLFNATSCSWSTGDASDVFGSEEEALARAAVLVAEHEEEQAEKMKRKTNASRKWAWHVGYHRRELARANRDAAHHASMLSVAQEKSK